MQLKKIKNGFLVSVEGIDGSGKSSLVDALTQELSKLNFKVLKTKEPGATKLGKYLRQTLQNREFALSDKAEFLLFAADRAQHMSEIVLPALKSDTIVISDRMADSSLAYQGYARGLNCDIIKTINNWAMSNKTPDLTFYLKIDYKTAYNRLKIRNQELTYFEKEKSDFFEKVISGFEEIFKDKANIIIINATQDFDKIKSQALEHLTKALN